MDTKLTKALAALRRAKTFEEGAEGILATMLEIAQEGLPVSSQQRSRMLRGMVHLRPSDGYRRLVVREALARPTEERASCVPSATAFRWVAKHACAASIDLTLGMIELDLPSATPMQASADDGSFDPTESIKLLRREATHLFALPLRSRGDVVEGMISLEADCRIAVGRKLFGAETRAELQMLADMAAAMFAMLPLRHVETAPLDDYLPVIGSSMAGLIEMLQVFAQQDETILLRGFTGAGKSKLAHWCHMQSARRARPFETVHLAAVSDELQMGELFGWRKGAFTTAVRDTQGSITRAEGGTLFIDEIDKLSLRAQAGLLRVLDERRYRPLGDGAGDRTANVRFIVATNADLWAEMRAGRFREDLYFRINVLPVRVPPLEERSDEIARWAQYMLERRHRGAPGEARIAAEAEPILRRYRWPGNLRQLENIVHRAYALALAESGPNPPQVLLASQHFHRALAFEPGIDSKSLVDLLHLAADAFVLEAERRMPDGEPFELDHAEALRGFVLATATLKLQSRKEDAFRLLGKANTVERRNHQAMWRREMEKVAALCLALGQASPFQALSDGPDSSQ